MVTKGSQEPIAADCDHPGTENQASVEEIKSYFLEQSKTVVTFVGYSGAGYEAAAEMLAVAGRVLDEFEPADTIVNIGAMPEGIGAVYELAEQRGFATTGIVSTVARQYAAELSPCVDRVFFVEDDTWGGLIDGDEKLSPTSTAMVEVSDLLVGIGGGEVARDELLIARQSGIEIRFFPADMNHQIALENAARRGQPVPTDFSGAAAKSFQR